MTDSEIILRLERLERQNRWLKRAGFAVLVVAGTILLAGFTAQRPVKPPGVPVTLEAQSFILSNARGEMRAHLSLFEDNPTLALYDAEGKPRIVLGVLDGGVLITVQYPGGKLATTFAAGGKGSDITLYGPDMIPRASLGVGPDTGRLEVSDRGGFKSVIGNADLETVKTGETHRTSAASVVLFDKEGKVIWRTP